MCITTYLDSHRIQTIKDSLVDTEISDLLKQINWCQSQEHIIEQRTITQAKRIFSREIEVKQTKLEFTLYIDIGNEWQIMGCGSGSREQVLAYLYGFLNGKESK